jgi:hypothetical protein
MNRYQIRIAYDYQEGSHLTSTHILDDSTLVQIISDVQVCRLSTTSAQYTHVQRPRSCRPDHNNIRRLSCARSRTVDISLNFI